MINIPIGLLSLFLTSRFVHDPPAFEKERATVRDAAGKLKIDGIGIALIALGSAALEILLDRGQIDDWFGVAFICWMMGIAVVCLVAAVFWELRQPDPVIDFRLLKTRNFAIANYPLLHVRDRAVRVDYADSADAAVAVWVSRYRCRAGAGAGRVCDYGAGAGGRDPGESRESSIRASCSLARWWLWGCRSFTTATSTWIRITVTMRWRVRCRGLGYAFFFVPLTMVAYSQLRPDQNNKASSLTNFFRNWGGSFGSRL